MMENKKSDIKENIAYQLVEPKGSFIPVQQDLTEEGGAGSVIIRQELAGICGTDVHTYKGKIAGINYPVILGHENVGMVESVPGEGLKDFLGQEVKKGDRVVVYPVVACGRCYYCGFLRRPDLCPNLASYGFSIPGGFSTFLRGKKGELILFKTNLGPEDAVLTEPLAVGVNAVEVANINLGDTVIIQGAGAIGLLVAACTKLRGASQIIVIDKLSGRLQLAQLLGATHTINIQEIPRVEERVSYVFSVTPGHAGADKVFECVGHPSVFHEGLSYVRKGGTYYELGHAADVGTIQFNPHSLLWRRCVSIVPVVGYRPEHFVRALRILRDGKVPFRKIITHFVAPAELNDIMKQFAEGYHEVDGREACKAVLDLRSGEDV